MKKYIDFNDLIPELSVRDINKSIDFYTKKLNFKIVFEREENKFALITYKDAQIMLVQIDHSWFAKEINMALGKGISIAIRTDCIQKYEDDKLKDYIVLPIEKHCYRRENKLIEVKHLILKDPDGYLLRFIEQIGIKDI